MSYEVQPGQQWRILISARGHNFIPALCRVEEIDGATVVLSRLPSGKRFTASLDTLRLGLRSARMVRDASGAPVVRPTKRAPPKSNAQARRAAALLAEGLSVTAIAERFGVKDSTVRNWATIVRREQRA